MCLKLAQMFVEAAARANRISRAPEVTDECREAHHHESLNALRNALACSALPPLYVRDVLTILHMIEGKPRV